MPETDLDQEAAFDDAEFLMSNKSLSSEATNSLVTDHLDHLYLVQQVVNQLASRYPRHVDRSELWSAGAYGLVDASRRFDPDAGIPFPRYAAIRIRGAIIDSTRTRDWATRRLARRDRGASVTDPQRGARRDARLLPQRVRGRHARRAEGAGHPAADRVRRGADIAEQLADPARRAAPLHAVDSKVG